MLRNENFKNLYITNCYTSELTIIFGRIFYNETI